MIMQVNQVNLTSPAYSTNIDWSPTNLNQPQVFSKPKHTVKENPKKLQSKCSRPCNFRLIKMDTKSSLTPVLD